MHQKFLKKKVVFIEYSKNIVNHLYEQSNSAQIKTGDVLIVLIEGLEFKECLDRSNRYL